MFSFFNRKIDNIDSFDDKPKESIEIYNSMKQVTNDLENSIMRGSFWSDKQKKEILKLKSDFFDLFKSLFEDKSIYAKFYDGMGFIFEIENLNSLSLSNMKSICDILDKYFTRLQKDTALEEFKSALKETIIAKPKPKIYSNGKPKDRNKDEFKSQSKPKLKFQSNQKKEILDKKIENNGNINSSSWLQIGLFFDIKDLSEENCYEIFEDFDFSKIDNQKIDSIFNNLKNILKNEKGKEEEFRNFLKFLIRTMNDYKKDNLEINERKLEEEKLKEIKVLLEKSFVSGLNYFKDFFVVFKEYQIKYSDIKKLSSFDELKNNPNLLESFTELRESFCSKYIELIENNYSNIFKDSQLDEKYYYNIFKGISDISKIYYLSNMSDEKFFIAFKRGFLVGDIYDFLSKIRKEFPSFDENAGDYLIKKIDEYELK